MKEIVEQLVSSFSVEVTKDKATTVFKGLGFEVEKKEKEYYAHKGGAISALVVGAIAPKIDIYYTISEVEGKVVINLRSPIGFWKGGGELGRAKQESKFKEVVATLYANLTPEDSEKIIDQEFPGLVHVLREIGYKTFKKGTLMPCDLVAEGKKYYGCEATFYFIYKESFSEEEFEKYITSIEKFVKKTRPTGLLGSLLQFVIASEKGFPSSFAEKVSKVTKKFNTPIYYVVLFDLSNNKMVFPNAGIIGSLAPRVSMNDLQKLEKIKLREVPVAGTHFCPKCGINVETQRFCPKCKRDLITGDTGKKTDSETKDIISLIANVFIPGVGTIIHGETMRGVVQLVLGIFGIITLILLIGFLIMPLIWLWAVIDGIFFVMKKELIFPSLK